jgi:hypothetical protein
MWRGLGADVARLERKDLAYIRSGAVMYLAPLSVIASGTYLTNAADMHTLLYMYIYMHKHKHTHKHTHTRTHTHTTHNTHTQSIFV